MEDAGRFTLLDEEAGNFLSAIQIVATLGDYPRYKISYDIKVNEFLNTEEIPRIYTGMVYPHIEQHLTGNT